MKINKNSIHFKYFSFLRKFEISFYKLFGHDDPNPILRFIIFNEVNWLNKLYVKLKIEDFNFTYNPNIFKSFNLFLKRFILYQFWGCSIIILFVKLLNKSNLLSILNEPGITIPKIFYALSVGVFPVIGFIVIIGFLWIIFKSFTIVIDIIREKISFEVSVSPFNNILIYILYLLIAPFYFLFLIIIHFLIMVFVTSFYYIILGIIWFFELGWLIIMSLFNILKLFKPIAIIFEKIVKLLPRKKVSLFKLED